MLQHLQIYALRNLDHLRFDPHPTLNIISGPNGSGKTSLLEAIHLLSLARSFRHHQCKTVIQHNQPGLTVHGRLAQGQDSVTIAVSRQREGGTQLKLAGKTLHTVAPLAAALPLQLITPDNHKLLTDGPKLRREFLDWGVFHVEPRFLTAWHQYQRHLKQRNTALRQRLPQRQTDVWDRGLHEAGHAIDHYRRQYLTTFLPIFLSTLQQLLPEMSGDLHYRAGWLDGQSLQDALKQHFAQDQRMGFTTQGPHRADLTCFADGQRAQDHLSRGQQKLWCAALRLAQAELLRHTQNKPCVFLVDDLPAELDPDKQQRLLYTLGKQRCQQFITCIIPAHLNLPTQDAMHLCLKDISAPA